MKGGNPARMQALPRRRWHGAHRAPPGDMDRGGPRHTQVARNCNAAHDMPVTRRTELIDSVAYFRRSPTSTPAARSAAISSAPKPCRASTASVCSANRGGAARVPPGVRDILIGVPRPR